MLPSSIRRLFHHIIGTCVAIALLFVGSCNKDEETGLPRIEITQVTGVTADGATFSGRIDALGSSGWTDYGFIWSLNNPPTNIGMYSSGQSPSTGPFSQTVSYSWLSASNYFVFAFIKKGGGLTISSPITFFAPAKSPEVVDFSPKTGSTPIQIHVTGKYLDLLQSPTLSIGDVNCNPYSITPNEIVFQIPELSIDGTFPVILYATGIAMQLNGTFTFL